MDTSRQRIDALIHLSDQVYPILEQKTGDEIRARRIVRLGMAAAAIGLNEGLTPSQAGKSFDDILAYEMRDVDFGKFIARGDHVRQLVPAPKITVPISLGRLANRYSDVKRVTILADSSVETDSVHALHLATWAVPYAEMFYPDLDSGKVSLYSLIHDLPETYADDVDTFNIDEEGLRLKEIKEAKAVHRIERIYGNRWPGLIDVIIQYESLADDEAKFVKTADKNEPGFAHTASNAAWLRTHHGVKSKRQFYKSVGKTKNRMKSYAQNYPLLTSDFQELTRRVAQAFDN